MLDKIVDIAFEKALEAAAGATITAAAKAFARRRRGKLAGGGVDSAQLAAFSDEKISEMARTPWGPPRMIVDANDPFGYTPASSFNCDFNNPNYGDERVVCTIKSFEHKKSGGWEVWPKVTTGDYLIRVYYHNSAAPSRVAKNSRIRAMIPGGVSETASITCCIYSENSSPPLVWSNLVLSSDRPFTLEYVQGSSMLSTNQDASRRLGDGVAMPSGQLIGWGVDGEVPGGYSYAGTLSFRVRVAQVASVD